MQTRSKAFGLWSNMIYRLGKIFYKMIGGENNGK